jgi:type III pantothenate kinase
VTPDVVVDIGNSRVKVGRCDSIRVVSIDSLPADDPAAWAAAIGPTPRPLRWVVAGVHPDRRQRFETWAVARGDRVTVIDSYAQVPIPTAVDEPSRVGIDRLLNALAAKHASGPSVPLIVIDVGSAVTIDYVDPAGVFQGGAILPGPWMMARSLHEFTAKLPLIDPWTERPAEVVGKNTAQAVQSGIQAAMIGAADAMIWNIGHVAGVKPIAFVTGGGRYFLRGLWHLTELQDLVCDEKLTLEGIRIAAEALP